MSLESQDKKKIPIKSPRAVEEVPGASSQEGVKDEAVVRALEMYLRQRALSSPTSLPRWVTW